MSLRSASLAQIIENSFIFEIRSPGLARCYLTTNASPARSFCVARITHTIETRSFPNSLVATLAILHSMSRVPRAPFFLLTSSRCHASQIVEQDLHIAQRRPMNTRGDLVKRRCGKLSTRSADLNNSGHVLANLRFSRFPLRLRRGFFPCARPLLSNAPFARSRFGFWLFRRRLPLSRCFAFLTHLLLVQILSKLLISKTTAKAGSSNCQCSCDLNWPAARCHVPRTFV